MDIQSKKHSPWVVIIFTALITFIVIWVLAWQYQQVIKKTEKTGEEVSSLKNMMEQQSAEDLLDKFMEARIQKNKSQSIIYFTEEAMDQHLKKEFILINSFKSFKILKSEKLNETKFKFIIKFQEEDNINYFVEKIIITKILDRYYIDSVEIVG